MEETALAVDIGTSGCRAILASFDGNVRSFAETSYHFEFYEKTGAVEQNPDLIVDSIIKVINECLSNVDIPVNYVVFSSLLHSLVLVDKRVRQLHRSQFGQIQGLSLSAIK